MRNRINFIVIAFLSISGSFAFAQPLADRVPADAIVYIGWRGSEDPGAGYKDSHAAAILAQSNFSAVFNDFLPRLILKAGQKNPEAGQNLQLVTAIGGPLWKHPTAVFVTGVTMAGPAGPVPKVGIICKAGPDAPALVQAWQSFLAKAPDQNAMQRVTQSGDLVIVTTGYSENDPPAVAGAEQPAGPKGPDPIGPTRTFSAAIAQVQSDPMSIVYIDVEKALALIDELAGVADPAGREKWTQVRDALGLQGLKRIIGTSGFDGKDYATQSFVEAPAPHKGITTLLDAKPVTDDLLKVVPQDASTVLAGSFDPAKLIETVRTTAAEVDPQAKVRVDQGLGAVSMFVGKNLQTEILEPLGEHWVLYLSPTVAGRGLTGVIVVNKLDDPKKAEQGLTSLAIAICNAVNSQSRDKDVSLRFQQTEIGDTQVSYIATPLVTPAWGVKDGNLYLALYPQNVAAAARATAGAGGKSILDNPDFIAMRKRLGVDKPTAFSYIDMRPTAGDGYQLVLAVMRLGLGMGDLMGVKAPEPVLPPLDVIMPHLSPAGSVSYVDEAGWHSKSVSPFPGAEILAGQQGIGAAAPALLASLALPALAKAKQSAQATASISNLRQIALGCQMYAQNHNGKLPPDLGSLLADGYVQNSSTFVTPTGGPMAIPEGLGKDQAREWVNQNTTYVFIAADKVLKDIPKPSATILAYERTGNAVPNRIAVAYVDGHCEILPEPVLKKLLAAANAQQ